MFESSFSLSLLPCTGGTKPSSPRPPERALGGENGLRSTLYLPPKPSAVKPPPAGAC